MPALTSIPRLYAIADAEVLGSVSISEAVEAMIGAGVRWIQVRAKRVLSDQELFQQLQQALSLAEETGTRIWVNDRVDIASLTSVFGLHLGQEDIEPALARGLVDESRKIGQSTHNEVQVRAAHLNPEVDVVAIGPVFMTSSKVDLEPELGLEGVRQARALTDKPLVAIGGITSKTIGAVLDAGADATALLGDLCTGDIAANCRRALVATGA